MSQPPGSPDPNTPGDPGDGEPVDPWATPSAGQSGEPAGDGSQDQIPYPPQTPYGQPPSGQYPAYGQPPSGQYPAYGQPPSGQYPAYGQPQYAAYGGYPRPMNGKAQAALWTGIALLVLSCCGAGIFGVVPIVLGVKARSEIRATGGQQSGDGLALAGVITGAIALVLSLAFIVLVVVAFMSGGSRFDTYNTRV
jgi:hypothetical protein